MSFPINPPADTHSHYRPSYLHSPTTRQPYAYPQSTPHGVVPPSQQQQRQHQHITTPRDMATTHRGLPPPSSMTLPDPGRGPPVFPALQQTHQPLPPQLARPPSPPTQLPYHKSEESQKYWFQMRAEEDRRRQEEEKTRQEELRLEQRRVDERMLRDAIAAGVPPHLIPIIFAGLGGGGMANGGFEMVKQYLSQFQQYQHAQQQAQQVHHPDGNPGQELRREVRSIQRPDYDNRPYPTSQVTPRLHTDIQTQQQQRQQQQGSVYPSPAHQSPRSRAPELQSNGYGTITTAARTSQSSLPLLTTNEAQVQRPATVTPNMPHNRDSQRHTSQSPSIYFHHWQPPSGSNGPAKEPTNPNKTSEGGHGHVSGSDNATTTNASRKRKATGGHQANPPPSSAPKNSTSPLSVVSNASAQREHGRNKGEILARDHPFAPANGGRAQVQREGSSMGETNSGSGTTSVPSSTKSRAEENYRRMTSPLRPTGLK